MRTYRSPWWSRLGWGAWQASCIAFFLIVDWDTASEANPAKPGLAFAAGLLIAFLSTLLIVVARDVVRGVMQTIRGEVPIRAKPWAVKAPWGPPTDGAGSCFAIAALGLAFAAMLAFSGTAEPGVVVVMCATQAGLAAVGAFLWLADREERTRLLNEALARRAEAPRQYSLVELVKELPASQGAGVQSPHLELPPDPRRIAPTRDGGPGLIEGVFRRDPGR